MTTSRCGPPPPPDHRVRGLSSHPGHRSSSSNTVEIYNPRPATQDEANEYDRQLRPYGGRGVSPYQVTQVDPSTTRVVHITDRNRPRALPNIIIIDDRARDHDHDHDRTRTPYRGYGGVRGFEHPETPNPSPIICVIRDPINGVHRYGGYGGYLGRSGTSHGFDWNSIPSESRQEREAREQQGNGNRDPTRRIGSQQW